MTCCAPGVEGALEDLGATDLATEAQLRAAARDLGDGSFQLDLAVPDVHCATCMSSIESALVGLPFISAARVNLSTKRVRFTFKSEDAVLSEIIPTLRKHGYRAFLLEGGLDQGPDKHLQSLIKALAVAGFAAGNIMLFSVSIWSGADEVTRNLFHWVSALIAIPAVIFAGQPFFRSAWGALRHRRLNMDVPISLAVSMALALSMFETAIGGENAYFDASVTLLFFLLIGRTIDHMMRERARGAVKNLSRMAPREAVEILPSGERQSVAVSAIKPDMVLAIAPGERLPVDCEIVSGRSEIDCSLVTGEPLPEPAVKGGVFLAGAQNLSGALTVRAMQAAEASFLARMIALMEASEGTRAGYRRIADRAADIYAPVVHVLALISFIGWVVITQDWHMATLNAMAVLIITCPCALALAVPMVHIVASGQLFERGILMKDSAALEKLAKVTHVVFDKTGTLTHGRARLRSQIFGADDHLEMAAAIATQSMHPLSQALVAHARATGRSPTVFTGELEEIAGAGIVAEDGHGTWKLGRANWVGADAISQGDASEVWLSHNEKVVAGFSFTDPARHDAASTIAALKAREIKVTLMSGDLAGPVNRLAAELGIVDARAAMTPEDKMAAIGALRADGAHILMVGDGINDAPALRASDVSMAPATAADVGRSAADFVFTHDDLRSVVFGLDLAQRADRAVKQNFAFAALYNAVAIPLAIFGFVTPLIAALAMSGSSIVVTLNALRLRLPRLTFWPVKIGTAELRASKLEPAE